MTAPKIIIGVDEVGVGALAGPLVVAAVAFEASAEPLTVTYRGLKQDHTITVGDSKGIKHAGHRAVLERAIQSAALGVVTLERSSSEIDQHRIDRILVQTTRLAVARLMEKLQQEGKGCAPAEYLVLLDGLNAAAKLIPCPAREVIDGDKTEWQIGAASIAAKVYRDERMDALALLYPEWDFASNKGYPSPVHLRLLAQQRPCPVHRFSYRPVAAAAPKAGIEE